MDRSEENQVWRGEGASEQEPIAGAVPAATSSGNRVLASIPDVDQEKSPGGSTGKKSHRGRLISQPLATKLLIGGGILLVLVAVGSFLARKPVIEGNKVLAPNAPEAPPYTPPTDVQVVKPVVETAPADLQNLNFNIPGGTESAPVSQVPDGRSTYGGQYEVQPKPPYGQQYQPPQSGLPVEPKRDVTREPVQTPPASSATSPQACYDHRGRPLYQADTRSTYRRDAGQDHSRQTYPAAPQTVYPHNSQPGRMVPQKSYPAPQPLYPANPPTSPATQYPPTATQYPTAPGTQPPTAAPQYPPGAPARHPTTAPTQYPTPRGVSYPSNISYPPAPSYPATQPGAARLEGTIANPSARSYERAR